jgi:hypothetical protein
VRCANERGEEAGEIAIDREGEKVEKKSLRLAAGLPRRG